MCGHCCGWGKERSSGASTGLVGDPWSKGWRCISVSTFSIPFSRSGARSERDHCDLGLSEAFRPPLYARKRASSYCAQIARWVSSPNGGKLHILRRSIRCTGDRQWRTKCWRHHRRPTRHACRTSQLPASIITWRTQQKTCSSHNVLPVAPPLVSPAQSGTSPREEAQQEAQSVGRSQSSAEYEE